MKLYLDTNILFFLGSGERDDFSAGVYEMLTNYENILQTSSVCVQEMVHLCQIGKSPWKKSVRMEAKDIIGWLHSVGVAVVSPTEKNLQALAELPMLDGHHDPNDRMIIAQAISDRTPLVSSDHQFKRYLRHGLQLVFNER